MICLVCLKMVNIKLVCLRVETSASIQNNTFPDGSESRDFDSLIYTFSH